MSKLDDYDDYDAVGLAELVRDGEVTPRELLEEAIARAEKVNPKLNGIIEPMYELARRRVAEGLPEGPLRGVPFLIKDLNAAYAGVPMRSGSRLYRDHVPSYDSELVARYKAAGLSIFGKTNTPEFGILPVTEPELFGPTHNPWDLSRTSGGSSGGSAAMVAAGVVPAAHGGDGGGSLRIPASCCGLFSMKPSRGRMPTGPEQSEQFHGMAAEHVISRSVRDSAAFLDATAGPGATSPYAAIPAPSGTEGSFLEALAAAPRKMRIAFTADPLLPADRHPSCVKAVEEAAALCEELGHEVVEERPPVDAHAMARGVFLMFCSATAGEIREFEEERGREVKPEEVEITTWLASRIGFSLSAGELSLNIRRVQAHARKVLRFFEGYDLLLTPTLGKPPMRRGEVQAKGAEALLQKVVARGRLEGLIRFLPQMIDRAVDRAYHFAPFTPVINATGQPSASVPLFWDQGGWEQGGLPIGVCFTARLGAEAELLRFCAQLEEARPWKNKRPPIYAGKR